LFLFQASVIEALRRIGWKEETAGGKAQLNSFLTADAPLFSLRLR
jgi:hypothetical protein